MDKLWYIKQWNIHVMMEYYAAIKKNEIMIFAATWMDILNNSCGEKHYLHVEVKNSKIGLIHTTKTDSQT